MGVTVGGNFAGRYSIESLLGEGGMGSVYRAHDAQLDRLVALKVVKLEGGGSTGGGSSPKARARLLREARSAAAFAHPNAVSVFDVGEVDGVAYIAMELIEGRTLRAYIDDRSAPLGLRIAWLRDVARALGAAHRRGIIHRDVKPENVMITREGTVKVLDFGIARRAQTTTDALAPTQKQVESLTGAGSLVGTPLYMAPEQIHGEDLDARVDQFAWGVMAHELMTGELPWGRERNVLSIVANMFSQPPRKARDATPEMPEELQTAISRALSRSPADRFETMEDLVQTFAPGTTESGAQPPSTRSSRWTGAHPAGARRALRAIAVGGVVVAAALAVAFVRGPSSSKPAPTASGAPSASGAPHGPAITDMPPPESAHPDALEAYTAGLHYIRSANLDAARESLELALERDPTLAAASLRLIPIILDRSMTEDPAPQFRRAMQLRDRLSPRDREILEAYAPVIETDPVDYKEAARRFERLVAAHPNDAELKICFARIEYLRQDLAAALGAIERALALDPEYGDALMLKVEVEQDLGRFDEGASDGDRCFAHFASIDCLLERSTIAQFTGAQDAMAIARKQLGLTPDSPYAAEALAGALFVGGAEIGALRAALVPARPKMPQRWQDCEDGVLAVISGDFPKAHALFAKWRDAMPMFEAKQARAAWFLVTLDEEMDDATAAVQDAELFASQMPAFASARGGPIVDAPILPILRTLLARGKLSQEQYERHRSAYILAATSQTGADGRARVWLSAYAEAARTPEEAAEALRVEPEYGEPSFHSMGGSPVGHAHLLAGDVAGAMPDLQRSARATDIFFVNPVAALQTHLDLGHALERGGDQRGACAQYAAVLRAWGSASPRSVSAKEAHDRARSMGCPREQPAR